MRCYSLINIILYVGARITLLSPVAVVHGFNLPAKAKVVKPVSGFAASIKQSSEAYLHAKVESNVPFRLNAWPLNRDPKAMSSDYPLIGGRVSITTACTFFTWWAQSRYTNVMASSALTLICSMCFDKRLGQAAFCGTFAGMGSHTLISSWQIALGLGGLTSILFECLIHNKNMFSGIGGRLGATAFIASSCIAVMAKIPTGVTTFSLFSNHIQASTLLFMAFWHGLGSVATIVLREVSDDSSAADPVRASATVGLIGALFLENKTAALALYGGSFVGMSLPSRLMFGILPGKATGRSNQKSTKLSVLTSFAIAGAIGGIIHGAAIDLGWWPGGWGGKAGLFAFIGCLVYRGLAKIAISLNSTNQRELATE